MITCRLAAFGVILACGVSAVSAQGAVDQRLRSQGERIEQEYRNGSLTKEQYLRLKAEQERIVTMERRAKADGKVSREELERLHAAQEKALDDIKTMAARNQRNKQPTQSDVDARQRSQRERISDEYKKGNLTREEYLRLQAEQARINDMERKAQADGKVSKKELEAIKQEQAKALRDIKKESKDSQKRGQDGAR